MFPLQDIDGEKCCLSAADLEIVGTVAKLLGLAVDDVKDVTLQRQINVRGNITEIPLKIQEVSVDFDIGKPEACYEYLGGKESFPWGRMT